MELIELKEIIELFLTRTIYEIKSETEVPNINFKFDENTIMFFKSIIENPFVSKNSWTPNISLNDINFLITRNHDDGAITLNINDGYRFFELLQAITNSLIKLKAYYKISTNPRNTAMNTMRRIWLRMGINDVENIEMFLEKQLAFLNNRTFDIKYFKKISTFDQYDVLMTTNVTDDWDETTRCMNYIMKDDSTIYELPCVLYDIDEAGRCYIYGVQNPKNHRRNKKVQRTLYKLNKGIENPNVHPSKVYSLLLFINELKKQEITKIIVPSMQVLSYDYHILLSKKAESDLKEAKKRAEANPDDKYIQKEYTYYQEWYERVHNKEDIISYLKTEELFNLVYRILEHDHSIEIINDINVQGDNLNIRIRK